MIEKIDVIQSQWLEHCKHRFPRDVAFPWRIKNVDKETFLREVRRRLETHNIYAGVYSYDEINSMKIDTVFIDIDISYDKLGKGVVMNFVYHICEKYGGMPRVYFTGNRGFAVYIDFDKHIKIENTLGVKKWIDSLVLESKSNPSVFDTAVWGDLKRVSRLPFTINQKSPNKRMCIPVDITWTIDEMISESEKFSGRKWVEIEPSDSDLIYKDLKRYEAEAKEVIRQLKEFRPKIELNDDILERLASLAPLLKDGCKRILHWIIIPRLVAMGKSDIEILSYCRSFVEKSGRDWNEYVQYVVRSIGRTRQGPGDGTPWRPLNFDELVIRYPDLCPWDNNEPKSLNTPRAIKEKGGEKGDPTSACR